MTVDLRLLAHKYIDRVDQVFPLEPGGKRPLGRLVPHGLHDATSSHTQVDRWWKTVPAANVALVTGTRFDVLDLDGPEGVAALDAALPRAEDPDRDPILIGPSVRTPRGWHCQVTPTGLGNRAGILPGVDWRGAGGYVVAPGSVRADGATWSWWLPEDPLYGPDADLHPAPAWILRLLDREGEGKLPTPVDPGRHIDHGDAYVRRALESEAGRVALAPEGQRNDQLNRSAHALGQLVGGGQLDAHHAGDTLLVAATRAGLTETEAVATIRSGLQAGIRTPRRPRSTT